MEMIHALGCSLLLVTVAFVQRPAQGAHALIGTWRLVEFADLDKDGKWQYWYGEHPRGYFVYDATGHVHVQIMKDPPLARFPESNFDAGKMPSREHAPAAYTTFLAYFGTYSGDTKKHLVTIHGAAWRRITPTRPAASLQTGRCVWRIATRAHFCRSSRCESLMSSTFGTHP